MSAKNLPQIVADAEGMNGSTVSPQYSNRVMKCYSITESEIHQISLSNMATTAFFGLGSALIAFGVDIFKDTVLADKIPAEALVLTEYIQPMCIGFGIVFWIFAIVTLWWRRDMFRIIKQESNLS